MLRNRRSALHPAPAIEADLDGARHALLAEATRRAVDVWAEGQAIGFNIVEPQARCDTVTAVVTTNGQSSQPLADYCREKCGVVLGKALGASEGKGFRIAHMGHFNAATLLGTGGILELNVLGFIVAVIAAVALIGAAEGLSRSRSHAR